MARRGGLDIGNAKEKQKELITKIFVARENIRAWIRQLRELEKNKTPDKRLARRMGCDKADGLDAH